MITPTQPEPPRVNDRLEIEDRMHDAAEAMLAEMAPEDRADWTRRADADLRACDIKAETLKLMFGESWREAVAHRARLLLMRERMGADLTANALNHVNEAGRTLTAYSWSCDCIDCRSRFPALDWRAADPQSVERAREIGKMIAAAARAREFVLRAPKPEPQTKTADWREAVDLDDDPGF